MKSAALLARPKAPKVKPKKIHNGGVARSAKVSLRERVLEQVQPAHVLDAFCGPDGEMWRAVWNKAASYVGIDEAYKPFDPRRRFVGDNRKIMRSIDLQAFNVFDLDAFGEPWEQLVILTARRTWSPGERGAVLFTWRDNHIRFTDGASHALAVAAGRDTLSLADKPPLVKMAIRRFLELAKLRALHSWGARGYSSATLGKRNATEVFTGGSMDQCYLALVFEGQPTPS